MTAYERNRISRPMARQCLLGMDFLESIITPPRLTPRFYRCQAVLLGDSRITGRDDLGGDVADVQFVSPAGMVTGIDDDQVHRDDRPLS